MARTPKTAQSVRLNFQVSPTVKDRLESLKERSGADSLTEVMRRALATYDILLEHYAEGSELILRRSDGTEGILLLPEGKS